MIACVILAAGNGEEGMSMKATEPLDMELVGELQDIMADGFVTLVDSYQRDSAQRLISMQAALDAEDRGQLRQLAHSLKGSSSNLGAVQVTALCIVLEGRVADADASELQALLKALDEAHVTAIEALTELCKGS
jgi:histidine phosphotransfer protein HptB